MDHEYSLKEILFNDEIHKKTKNVIGGIFTLLLTILQFIYLNDSNVVIVFLQISTIGMIIFLSLKIIIYNIGEKKKLGIGDIALAAFCFLFLVFINYNLVT
ncbi:hypothetical protein GH741_12580 [Aquibacillus halophilus]|uniref:Uncharacterized protein n=1 Tax=Aquibacillus halophilus TaxID=930132 RepID=A0A6A8DCU4_9BACI|nr:hypothetical protein [Aquibacillus halophilus]MRH43515.1 hypothetical protein [Aquibacillus halophilus]